MGVGVTPIYIFVGCFLKKNLVNFQRTCLPLNPPREGDIMQEHTQVLCLMERAVLRPRKMSPAGLAPLKLCEGERGLGGGDSSPQHLLMVMDIYCIFVSHLRNSAFSEFC